MEDPVVMTTPSDNESFWSKSKNHLTEFIEFIAIICAVVVTLHFFVAEPHKVSGSSMVPNFIDGDYIITDKVSKRFTDPKRGEVVIIKNPRNLSQAFIKRIIGLPGESIQITEGKVSINNNLLPEPYLPSDIRTPGGASFLVDGQQVVIPEDSYFVMGDNRGASSDSREWGFLKKEYLIGYPWLRYWPPQRVSVIEINKESL